MSLLTEIEAVRFKDLRDPEVLRKVLRACRDDTEVPGRAPGDAGDPFAAFFSGQVRQHATVAEVAAARLDKTGLPGDPATVEVIAQVLAEPGPGGKLPRLVAKALGETRWADVAGAVRAIVPALERYDEPLYEAIVRLPEQATAELARIAGEPLRPRLFQELLNHPPSHDAAVAAAEEAVLSGRYAPDETAAASLLSVLAAWSEPASSRLAGHLEARFPWAVTWRAVDEPEARPALRAWLEAGAPGAPAGLLPRVAEVLRQREPVGDFPLDALLRVLGDEHGLVAAWGVPDDATREVLTRWVTEPDRVATWSEALLITLARAGVAGLREALLRRLQDDPGDVASVVAALDALGPEACRAAAEQVLARAEAAPVAVEPAGKGTVREHRAGIDVESLEPLVARLGDPSLAARLDAVMPVVRAG